MGSKESNQTNKQTKQQGKKDAGIEGVNPCIFLKPLPTQSSSTALVALAAYTVKSVLSGHSKIDKTRVLKTSGSLVQVKSTAECSTGAVCNTFDQH